MLAGLLLAIMPHLAWHVRESSLDYLADNDDIFYLLVARVAYFGDSALRDPFSTPSRPFPNLYSWLQFAPLARLGHALGLDTPGIALLWRAVGGPLLALSFFVLFRRIFRETRFPAAFALGCAVICLSDDGVATGRSLIQVAFDLPHLVRGTVPAGNQNGLQIFRVVTPLLNLPLLILMAACLAGPRDRLRWGPVLVGIFCLGMCFYLYFFFWTAGVCALAGFVVAQLRPAARGAGPESRRGRLVAAKAGVLVLLGGLALGGPQVVGNARTFDDPGSRPILERTMRGRPLPEDEPARWNYLRRAWPLAKIAFGALAVYGLGMASLEIVWWLSVSGLVLTNSALVTGLEFENFHWLYVAEPFGEVLLLGGFVLAADRWRLAGRRGLVLLAAVPVAYFAFAVTWRAHHALTAPEGVEFTRTLAALRPLRPALRALEPEDVLAGDHAAKIALLWSRSGLLYHHPNTGITSLLPDREVNERHALNAWLRGLDEAQYRAIAGSPSYEQGLSSTPEPWTAEGVARRRLEIFREIQRDPQPFLRRYRPSVLLLPASAGEPNRAGPWTLIRRSPDWTLWRWAPELARPASPGSGPPRSG